MEIKKKQGLCLSSRCHQPLLIALLAILCLGSWAAARDMRQFEQALPRVDKLTADIPHVEGAVYYVGKIGLTVTNTGTFGNAFIGDFVDPVTGQPAPSCTYPYGSNLEYLFGGAIWVGAVVGTDTLVTVAADGWLITREMWPDSLPVGALIRRSIDNGDPGAKSQEDIIAVYTDTLTDPDYAVPDFRDGRPHIPLGIEITQKTYAWGYPLTEDFVIFDLAIKNIGTNVLTGTYIGIYADADVYRKGSATGWSDDICGFKKTVPSPQGCGFIDTVNIAWIADNDGKESYDICPYTSQSLTSVTGVRVLYAPSDSLKTAFNWWLPNSNAALDFGPRRAGTTEYPFRDFGSLGGLLGTPEGDKNKYYMMHHEEIDYDQLFTAVDHTSEGWLAPPSNAAGFADGIDTRYLLSFGPFDILPGQTLPIVFAYVGGENFHTDCDAFANLFNASSPDAFADQLDFSDLALNALTAEWIYDIPGVDTDSDGYKGKYRICGVDTFYYKGDGVPDLFAEPPTDIPGQPGPPGIPKGFALHQNYPNPFNAATEIAFEIPARANVTLTIFNILGQAIREIEIGEKPAGSHSIIWDGTDDSHKPAGSGIYFYKVKAGEFASSKKMILLK
ncbi:MAG: T9SS type A sorting domain-containing protein [candidate division Zixibacteria bacterium]|nr:T9SS type A sorting domain-containing protein [candidate division Zixibacteria bacterium]